MEPHLIVDIWCPQLADMMSLRVPAEATVAEVAWRAARRFDVEVEGVTWSLQDADTAVVWDPDLPIDQLSAEERSVLELVGAD